MPEHHGGPLPGPGTLTPVDIVGGAGGGAGRGAGGGGVEGVLARATPTMVLRVPHLGIEIRGREQAATWLRQASIVGPSTRLTADTVRLGAFVVCLTGDGPVDGPTGTSACHVLELEHDGGPIASWCIVVGRSGTDVGRAPSSPDDANPWGTALGTPDP